MQVTGNEIITRALRLIGKLGEGEPLLSEAAEDARLHLNELLDQWQVDRIMVFAEKETQHSLTASAASYTIGTGATWNQTRPTEIIRALVVPDTGADPDLQIPMQVLTPQRWADYRLKQTQGTWPFALYYDRRMNASGYGTVHVYPVPTGSAAAVILWTKDELNQFADLTTQYQFPPGYARALRTNLAMVLAPEYGVQPPPLLERQAGDARETLQRMNHNRDEMAVDAALRPLSGGGSYNVYTDGT